MVSASSTPSCRFAPSARGVQWSLLRQTEGWDATGRPGVSVSRRLTSHEDDTSVETINASVLFYPSNVKIDSGPAGLICLPLTKTSWRLLQLGSRRFAPFAEETLDRGPSRSLAAAARCSPRPPGTSWRRWTPTEGSSPCPASKTPSPCCRWW